jgi:hypothetical protein
MLWCGRSRGTTALRETSEMLAAGAGQRAPVMITGAHPALVSDTSRINSGVSRPSRHREVVDRYRNQPQGR